MFQVVQNLKTGKTELIPLPMPMAKRNHTIIKTSHSLISSGTEKSLVDFGKSGLIGKALSQPEKVRMVLDKAKTDGIAATYDAVSSKLDEPMQLGYCNVGTVIESDSKIYSPGTRVVSNGKHASMVRVSDNLIAKIPDNVKDEEAVFTVLGAIALQGIRITKPTMGELVVVTGLGLIGLLTVQLLKANGCKVIGIDYDSQKCDLAKSYGADVVDLSKNEDPISIASNLSKGQGVDAVIITASSKSNDIVHQAATMSRKKGRITLVGVVGLHLNRSDFYEKELTFQVSCSYGPGRYDPFYEDNGNDYPYAYVRWTEQRNFEAVLDLMAERKLDIESLISYNFALEKAGDAYHKLDEAGVLGIIINYPDKDVKEIRSSVELSPIETSIKKNVQVSFIGAGNYASRVLMPMFRKMGAGLNTVITSSGITAVHHGKKLGFKAASTNIDDAFNKSTDAVVIATQHNLHASQIIQAIKSDIHVFVEKPLAISIKDIEEIERHQKKSNSIIMVGYNRRFSPHIQKIKSLIDMKKMPKTFIMTMNAGFIPKEHWTQDFNVGGGRIIGEACHYIDLMRYLAGSKIKSFDAIKINSSNIEDVDEDKAIITLQFECGSIGSIHYFANGHKSFPKERIEVFCDGSILQADNFLKLSGYGFKSFKKNSLWRQDKGQQACVKNFIDSIKGNCPPPIPIDEIFEVAKITTEIDSKLRNS